jgi:hypothetical protein
MHPLNLDRNANATNVRKMDALTQKQIVGRLLTSCNGDLSALKIVALGEQCRRQAAKLTASR